jgi:Flp pilus assembly protein TadG
MLYSTQRRLKLRRAAAVVEFAVVGVVFVTLLFGIIEIGRGFMVHHLLTNAARLGCRLGVVEGTSTAQINAAVTNALSTEGISGDVATVTVNDGVTDASTAASGAEITVKVSVAASNITWIPGTNYVIGNIASQYTLRRE